MPRIAANALKRRFISVGIRTCNGSFPGAGSPGISRIAGRRDCRLVVFMRACLHAGMRGVNEFDFRVAICRSLFSIVPRKRKLTPFFPPELICGCPHRGGACGVFFAARWEKRACLACTGIDAILLTVPGVAHRWRNGLAAVRYRQLDPCTSNRVCQSRACQNRV